MPSSRVKYSIKNARVTLIFYLLMLLVNFFSRRVFIDFLGSDLVGLTGTMLSYIGFLNLAELGISVAIANALYLPLHKDDKPKINEIVSLYGFIFRWVGLLIGTVGLLFSCFFPIIFAGAGLPLWVIYLTFYTFMATTMLSYLVNYKQNLLNAGQKGYIAVRTLNISLIVKITLQMVCLKYFEAGMVSYLLLEVVFGVVFSVWLSREINKEYPWLKSSYCLGKIASRNNPSIFKNIRQFFSQRIAGFVLINSDPIVVQNIMGFSWVTNYTNYTMIMQRVVQLIAGSLNNSYASVGNLVAAGDKAKIKQVFWQFNALYFWIGGLVSFGFFHLIGPFIPLWLGDEGVVLSKEVTFLLAMVLFFNFVRNTQQYYLNAYGLYGDVWAAWSEAALNLTISIVVGLQYGLIGIVGGTAISTFIFAILWKPYYLYRYGFGQKSTEYWLTILKHTTIIAIAWTLSPLMLEAQWMPSGESWLGIMVQGVATLVIFGGLSGVGMYFTSSGMRTLIKLWMDILLKRK
ncbi:MAG: sugar transporter [Mucinivorans sp.]